MNNSTMKTAMPFDDLKPDYCLNETLHNNKASRLYVDQGLCVILLIITISIGLYQNHQEKKDNASSSLSPFFVALSLCTSFLSTISILGPVQMIYSGINWFLIGLSYPLFTLVTIYFIAPKLKDFDSIFSVIEAAYGKIVSKICMIVYICMSIYYTSGVLMACCKAAYDLFNVEVVVIILITGLIVTLFTSFGGLKSVIYIEQFKQGFSEQVDARVK